MDKIKHWWGWEIQENGQIVGSVVKDGFSGWGVFDAERTLVGERPTRKKAIDLLLNPPVQETPLFGRWVSADEIRESITESAFRIGIFEHTITILDSNLGQPRHGEPIMGARLFLLGSTQ